MTDLIPLYALYALLFADSGMSDAQISALFAIWSIVGIAAEVPSGALDGFAARCIDWVQRGHSLCSSCLLPEPTL